MDRRAFIKLTAITGTSAALTSCGSPDHHLIRFVPDEDIVQGQAEWRPSVCPLCAAGCGLTVRVMDADADVVRNGQAGVVRILAAKKLEGHPEHPVNTGGLCARGQAAIQLTYHPDRITQPLRRTGDRGTGGYEAVSWDEAIGEVAARIDALRTSGDGGRVAYLARRRPGYRAAVIDRLLAALEARPAIACEVFDEEVLRQANALSFGRAQLPTFDLGDARFVLSLGADFLGTWNSPVAQARAYGVMRQGRPGVRGAFVQVESRMTQTGACADEWLPARPGTEGVLALGIAHLLMADGRRGAAAAGTAGTRLAGWSEGLPDAGPESVAATTGVPVARLVRLADQLAGEGAVVMAGGPPLAHTNGLFTALAVNALNALIGAVDRPGGLLFTPQLAPPSRPAAGAGALARLAADLLSDAPSAPQVVIVDGANAVFATPPAWRLGEALARVPFLVSTSPFLDETTALADLILPDHTFLERWSEALPESGSRAAVASVAPPVMRPLYDTRATPDVLLEIGRRLGEPLDLPWDSFEDLLAGAMGELPARPDDFDTWSGVQARGGWWGEAPQRSDPAAPAAAAMEMPAALAYAPARFDGNPAEYPFHLLPAPSTAFYDGSLAHLPWLQEMPDPLTSAMWSSWIEVNPATAAALGIETGDLVEVASSHGTLRTAALVSPGIAPDVVAMPVGQGHRTFTRYASGRGENPIELLAPVTEEATGALAWAATRVRIARVGRGDGRLILFAGGMHEHPHVER
jgi:menaquinone reductase, molybdopterin-binding-like subunit